MVVRYEAKAVLVVDAVFVVALVEVAVVAVVSVVDADNPFILSSNPELGDDPSASPVPVLAALAAEVNDANGSPISKLGLAETGVGNMGAPVAERLF